MADSGSEERTEQATPKRLKEARSKGKLSMSQDLTGWLAVGAAAAMLPVVLASARDALADQVFTVRSLIANPEPGRAMAALGEGLGSVLPLLTPLFVVVVLAVVAGAAMQGGIRFKKPTGKFEQFNLVNGMKRVFGLQALWQGTKVLMKTAVVAAALYLVIQGVLPELMGAGGLPLSALLAQGGGAVAALLQSAIAAALLLAAVDVFVVMKRNRKHTRMTKKEVRDENKNTEGDPLIKSQRRSRQLAMSRNRMIAAIGGADVVLVNPTHVAVALSYEPGRSAPRVVAKGAGTIAARIRQQAEDDGVPLVRDVPLARALHAACDIGQEIPPELYQPVAQVLAFVMALKERGRTARTPSPSVLPSPPPHPSPVALSATSSASSERPFE